MTTSPSPSSTLITGRLLIRAVAALVLVAIIAVTCSRLGPRKAPDDGEVTFAVASGPLTISITEAGTIKPTAKEIIKCEIEGRSTILYLIEEGTRVQQGDLLVELDASQLEDNRVDQEIQVHNSEAAAIQSRENLAVVRNQATSDVERATLDLRFAIGDLQQYREGLYPNALKEAEAKITLAEEELRRSEEKLKWSSVLFDEQYLSESEYQADELQVKKAKLDVELAQSNLGLLKDFTYPRQIELLESDARQAEMALERVKRRAAADVVQADANLWAKESEFQRQKDKLDKLQQQISRARIFAPRDGLVVYSTSTQMDWRGNREPLAEGQEVREGEELIHLPTASTFLAELRVHESNIDRIRVDQTVRITVDALPGQAFNGTISNIAPLPDPTSAFMNPDLKVYKTEVTVDSESGELRTGMSCAAEVIVARYPEALFIPVQCVLRVGGQPTVFVSTRTGTEPRSVEIGLDNNRMIRILSGLQPGEHVLLAPPLEAGTVGGERHTPEPDATPAAAPAPPSGPDTTAAAATAPEQPERMNPEQMQKLRERFENMSPEEREAWKRRREPGRRASE